MLLRLAQAAGNRDLYSSLEQLNVFLQDHPAIATLFNGGLLALDARGVVLAGAPAVPDQISRSLAGRDDVVAAAVAGDPIGVDVEVIAAPFEPPLHVLHPAERAVLETAGQGAYEIFLLLWTAKEAYVKALGAGLAREPREIEIRLAGAGGCGAFEVFDCGRRVPAALAWTGRALVRQRPVMLACFVAGR